MRIEQHFAIPFTCERVWAFLHDTAAVARCLPGIELTATAPDGQLTGHFSIKLGPIAAAFSGNAEIVFDETAQKGEITGSGSDRKSGSRAKGSLSFALADEPGGTRIDLALDYALAGALAQFNRGGIVQDLAKRLTAQFAENLGTALDAAAPMPTAPSLDAGNMLINVFWDGLRRWMHRLFGRT